MGEGEVAVGDRLVNEPQAKALELIAESGTFAFYEGALANAIVKTVEAGGGVLSAATPCASPNAAPIVFDSGKHTVCRPSTFFGWGGDRAIFGVLEAAGMGALTHAGRLHPYIEASKHAFADRASSWPIQHRWRTSSRC